MGKIGQNLVSLMKLSQKEGSLSLTWGKNQTKIGVTNKTKQMLCF
jgi:hypothetical protein